MISKKSLFVIILVVGVLMIAASILIPFVSSRSAVSNIPETPVAIIGGADGPTAEYLTSTLTKELYLAHYLPLTLIGGGALVLGIVGFAVCHSQQETSGE